MSDATLTVDDGVATVTIDRPERRNAISPEVVSLLGSFLTEAESNEDVKVLVITGSGDKAFCAGGDLGGISGNGPVAQHETRGEIGTVFARMRKSRLPIIARVNGHALAGGFGLMLACDLVVAVDDAQMGMPEVNLGLWPFMISALAHRDIPRKVALDLMLTGRRIPAAEGERWGFVNRVVPRADLDQVTAGLAGEIASKSPLIVKLGKTSFYRVEDQPFEDAVSYLEGMLTLTLQTEDAMEGVQAFFQKRPPEWKNK